MPEHPATRLYIPQQLEAGVAVALDQAQAHRLRHVLRLMPGAAVAAFNESAGEWLCRLGDAGHGGATLAVECRLRPPAQENDLWLLFAPLKRARLDWLVEKATELGAAALVPVWTERTQPERLNRDRLQAIAIAAAEQSERLSVPEVFAPERLDRVLAAGRPAALLVGPEGGFAETELDALGKLPIVSRVGLGPRVLRAETAAVAALAVFQAIAGDWRRHRAR